MDLPKTLDEFETMLDAGAGDTKSFFGVDIDGVMQRLQIFCHPDRHPDDKDRATKLFAQLGQMADEARAPAVLIKSSKRTYVLDRRLGVGDVADIYVARDIDVKSIASTYVVKVSRIPGAEKLLDQERQALTALQTAAADKGLNTFSDYYPLLVESFPAVQSFKRRVNVFAYLEGMYTLTQLAGRCGGWLDAKHAVWIYKRLMTALAFAHEQDVVHTAVFPEHILIHPKRRQVQVIGWGQSVEAGKPLTSYVAKQKLNYPAGALDKQPTQSGADAAMAARIMMTYTQFKERELPLKQFFVGCMIPGQWKRPADSFGLYDEFTALAKRLYGEPKYEELRV